MVVYLTNLTDQINVCRLLRGKPEVKEYVRKFSHRWENKINVHLKMCKEITWNGFNWLRMRTDYGVF